MSTKYITTSVKSSYTLNLSNYSAISITSSGGIKGSYTFAALGGDALTLPGLASAFNSGLVTGGSGGDGATNVGGAGGTGFAGGSGVSLAGGGYVLNSHEVLGGYGGQGGFGLTPGVGGAGGAGVAASGGGTTIKNNGSLAGGQGGPGSTAGLGGVGGTGISMATGGYVLNGAGVQLRGGVGGSGGGSNNKGGPGGTGGVALEATASVTVVNRGTIDGGLGGSGGRYYAAPGDNGVAGGGGDAIRLLAGGTVTNLATIDAGDPGITLAPAYGTLNSLGNGVSFANGGTLINGSSTVSTAVIYGQYGVYAAAGGTIGATVTSYATIHGLKDSVLFKSSLDRLVAETSASFTGAIAGGGGTLELAGGSDTLAGLGATATLSGAAKGTFSAFGAYAVDNGATLTLTGAASLGASHVFLNAGSLSNTGTFTVGGSLNNTGTITASVGMNGVNLNGSGQVVNSAAKAAISGKYGVYGLAASSATVTNFGTISGTTYSVVFESATDQLILEAGSTLTGFAYGGGGTLELAGGSETISGLGGNAFITGSLSANVGNFGTYVVDAAASVVLSGASTLAAGKSFSNAGALTVAGSLMTAGALGNLGFITVQDGYSIQAQGLITNAGTIDLASAASNTDLLVLAAGATLGGGGTVLLDGSKSLIVGATAAATLTNLDNTLSGAGFLGANSLTLTNETAGVIEATGGVLAVGTKGETLTNAGLMEATGGGTLVLANTTIANASGTILANSGAPVKLQDDVIRGGGITAAGTGVVKINLPGGELDGTASAVSLSGFIHVVSASNEILEGSIANAGKLNLTAGSKTCDLIIGAAGATLSGGGQVNLSNSLGNHIYGQASGDTLTNVDNRIDGAGLLGNGVMTLVNEKAGQILGNQNLSLTIDTGANTITNAGLIENVGKGGTLVKSAVANTGTLLALTTGTLTLAGAVTGAGGALINGGTLYAEQAFGEKVTFTGATGTLKLGDSQAFTGKVAGLSSAGTNFLDLADIGLFASKTKATYSGTSTSGTLTVTDGIHTAHIFLIGDYLGATWMLAGDGNGGTKVSDPNGSAAPLSQAISSFHPRATAGLAVWAAHPPPSLLFAQAQT